MKERGFFLKLKIKKVATSYGWPNSYWARATCWVGAWVQQACATYVCDLATLAEKMHLHKRCSSSLGPL